MKRVGENKISVCCLRKQHEWKTKGTVVTFRNGISWEERCAWMWADFIEVDLWESESVVVDWIQLANDKIQLWVPVIIVTR